VGTQRPSAGVLDWLLEAENPSVRYLTLRDLLDRPEDDPEVRASRDAIVRTDPARRILDAQWPEGYWGHVGIGYSPKYKATIWQIIFLMQLGAPPIPAIRQACEYVLAHSRLSGGTVPGTDVPEARFSAYTNRKGAIICLNGNVLRALRHFGYGGDPRVLATTEALLAQITRDHFRCRFNGRTATGRLPPRMDQGLPCVWGAIKALSYLADLPESQRAPAAEDALAAGVELLLSHDLTRADYPNPEDHPNHLWWQFGFPLGYASDALEALELLGCLGYEADPRLAPAIERVWAKADERGRWTLEYTPRSMWASFGKIGHANKWVTLRALRALRRVGIWGANQDTSS